MLSAPVTARYSIMPRATLDFSVQSNFAGSVISWHRIEQRRLPPFFGAAACAWACGTIGWPVIVAAMA